jgi:hypothetical protein
MACALTQGYSLPCKDSKGGIKSVRFTEWANIDTSTAGGATITAASGIITAMTLAGSNKFWKYELPPANKDKWDEMIQSNNETGTLYYEQDLQVMIRKLSATLRNEIRLLAQNRLACIVHDQNDNYWLLGEKNGIELEPSTASTGAGRGDFNGYTLKFNGQEGDPAQQVSSSIIDGITN